MSKLPHCDELFRRYFDPWYDARDRKRRDFEATRPDVGQATHLIGRSSRDLGPLAENEQAHVASRVDEILDAVRRDWPKYLSVEGEIDGRWIDAFDRYYDRQQIAKVIQRSDPKNEHNDYLVLCCQFGAALGHVLRSHCSRLIWWFDRPFWDSALFDPEMGTVIPTFHWAVKKMSEYGVDDGFAAKIKACVQFITEQRDLKDNPDSNPPESRTGKKLEIWLPDDWSNVSDQDPDGPPTMCWDDPDATGAVQISVAEYSGGEQPQPNEADLIEFATNFGEENEMGKLSQTSSGRCVLGLYGTASFRCPKSGAKDAPAYCQVWFLSNGLDFVFVTFIASNKPTKRELQDAQRIVEAINLK